MHRFIKLLGSLGRCVLGEGATVFPKTFSLSFNRTIKESMVQKIFVTGGNGFIGSRVVYQLIQQGYGVRCLLRPTSETARIDELPIECVLGDIRDLDSLCKGMAGCDGVIHLASLSNWEDIHSPRMHEVVVEGSLKVLTAAQRSGNLRTIYVSSSIAVGGTNDAQIQHEESPFLLHDQQAYAYAFCRL